MTATWNRSPIPYAATLAAPSGVARACACPPAFSIDLAAAAESVTYPCPEYSV